MIEAYDKAILAALQADFPLTGRPYAELAAQLGISEQALLQQIKKYQESGLIRKIGAVLHHREVGFAANALGVWQVPADQLDRVGSAFAAHPAVSHCYARAPLPAWPYTLYTMIHGTSPAECEACARELADQSGIKDYNLLYSLRELKKSSMRYFVAEEETEEKIK